MYTRERTGEWICSYNSIGQLDIMDKAEETFISSTF
jgi:hypothetical protein